jgi:DNA polymerase-3 subunit delta
VSIVLVVADDPLLVDRELETVRAEWLADGEDVQVRVHEAPELEALPELRTLSLFGDTAAHVIRGTEKIRAAVKRELLAYLEAPAEDVPIAIGVLVSSGRAPADLKKAVAPVGEVREVQAPADWDEKGWTRLITGEFERHGRPADRSAVEAIRAHAGSSTATMAAQVAQVVAGTPGDGRLTSEDVENRDPGGALVAARGALEAGTPPTWIANAVIRRASDLLEVRAGGRPPGMRDTQANRLTGISRRQFEPGELAWIHERLARLDLDLRGSDMPDDILLETALIEVSTRTAVGAPWNPAA